MQANTRVLKRGGVRFELRKLFAFCGAMGKIENFLCLICK